MCSFQHCPETVRSLRAATPSSDSTSSPKCRTCAQHWGRLNSLQTAALGFMIVLFVAVYVHPDGTSWLRPPTHDGDAKLQPAQLSNMHRVGF